MTKLIPDDLTPAPATTSVIQGLVREWVWLDSPNWAGTPNSKNYLAVIKPNVNAPGGLERAFKPTAKGVTGFVVRDLAAGDAIEIGSTRINNKGGIEKRRNYYLVAAVSKNSVIVHAYPDAASVFTRADNYVETLHVDTEMLLTRQLRDLDATISDFLDRRNQLAAQINSHTDGKNDPDTFSRETQDGYIDPDAEVQDASTVPAKKGATYNLLSGNDVNGNPVHPAPEKKLPLERLEQKIPSQIVPMPDDDDDDDEPTPEQLAILKRSL